jgi:hypothetical protein
LSRAWRLYKAACVWLVTAAALAACAAGALAGIASLTEAPAADAPSPDGRLSVRVFTAGQGAVPPDYRAGVRFYIHDPGGWPLFRLTEIASADFADGWSVDWTGAREVTLRAGPRSWFNHAATEALGVTVRVVLADRPPGEARCIEQTFADAIDGVTCFDALVRKPEADPAPDTGQRLR